MVSVTKYKKPIWAFVLVFIVFAVGIFVFKPLNKSIDFSGGFVFHIANVNAKTSIENLIPSAKIVTMKDVLLVKIPYSDSISFADLSTQMESFGELQMSSMVAPVMTSSLIQKSFTAVILSILVIFVYIFLRFNFYYGLGAVVTLLHDAIATIAFIKIFNIEFDITIIAAILTVIGYSINDTVIIYDKIRSNLSLKSDLQKTIDESISETLPRTIGTSLTTILAILPVVFLASGSIRDFCLVVIFGVFFGTFSSIAVSALALVPFQKQIFNIIKLKKELSN